MQVRLEAVKAFERPVRLRLPFRFGIIVLREAPQVLLRVRISDSSGRAGQGIAAEMLAPKWFDKNPDLSNEQNFNQLRDSIRIATQLYLEQGPLAPFELSMNCYRSQLWKGDEAGLNPLVASFGPALLDRAILDAACRLEQTSFWEAVRHNLPAFCAHPEIEDLGDLDWSRYLSTLRPLKSVHARHTVGLLDPITAADQLPEERVADGLPETLEEVVDFYGHRYFKVKVSGEPEEDLDRLESIAAVVNRLEGCRITLDGNEQFKTIEQLLEFTRRLQAHAPLQRFWRSVLFLEQPLDRGIAWDSPLQDADLGQAVIADESDGTLNAFLRARELGYRGISSKACKGFYKSILNRVRCHLWNRAKGTEHFFMSGEDLTTQAGVAVQQDLALAALLGLDHVERNGHHYVKGFAGVSSREAEDFLEAHPGLYGRVDGTVCLQIREGCLDLSSLGGPGFACNALPDFDSMEPVMVLQRG